MKDTITVRCVENCANVLEKVQTFAIGIQNYGKALFFENKSNRIVF